MNQELDKVLYHAISSYQLLEVMLHRLLFHPENRAVLLLPDFIVEKYPQWPLLERRGFFNQVRLFPYLRIPHGEESQAAALALAAYEQWRGRTFTFPCACWKEACPSPFSRTPPEP